MAMPSSPYAPARPHFEPPLELEATGDRDRDARAGVKKVVAIMERYIGEHPEQWVMSVPLWQTTDNL
jgi:lauroyl/myristoyl acyltransferase